MDRWSKLIAVVALVLGVMLIALEVSIDRETPELSGTFTLGPEAEAVSPDVLARDFRNRLARSGATPKSVACWQYLLAKPGATAHCEARFKTWFKGPDRPAMRTRSGWLADRAEYTVTQVSGREVQFAITPGLSSQVLPYALQWDDLVKDAMLDCPGGSNGSIEGVVGAAVKCTARYLNLDDPSSPERRLLVVGVDSVSGFSMDLKILEAGPPLAPDSRALLPPGAWFDTDALPLQNSGPWPDLAAEATPLDGHPFTIEQMCGAFVFPPTDGFPGAVGARTYVNRYPSHWALQQLILDYPGDPWAAGRKASSAFHSLVAAMSRCGAGAPDARVTITTPDSPCAGVGGGCRQIAGTIEVPWSSGIAHVYLSSVGSAVSELSFLSYPGFVPSWPALDDATILATMNRSLCAVWTC